jgi:hypothetical protein
LPFNLGKLVLLSLLQSLKIVGSKPFLSVNPLGFYTCWLTSYPITIFYILLLHRIHSWFVATLKRDICLHK